MTPLEMEKMLQAHDQILRGRNMDDPGLVAHVRNLLKLVPIVEALQSGDFRQSAVIDALLRLAATGMAVGLGIAMTRYFS